MYKYFSPMESHRGSNDPRDPYFYEGNREFARKQSTIRWMWYEPKQPAKPDDYARWVLGGKAFWEKLMKDGWKPLDMEEENEFGVISP